LRERFYSPYIEFNRSESSIIDIGEKENLKIISKFQIVSKKIKKYNPLTKSKIGIVKKSIPTNYRRVIKDL
jgi:hypothetical protein